MEDDWDRRIDRRFEELKNLLMELAAQKGLTIAPRTGPIQSSEGNSAGEPDDRTLLVKIHSMEYRISCEVLELVFSRFGILEDVEILDSGSEFHSRIRFRDRDSAIKALEYDGRDIYDGCCRMELILGYRNNSALNETEVPTEGTPDIETPIEDPTQVEELKELESTTVQGVSYQVFQSMALPQETGSPDESTNSRERISEQSCSSDCKCKGDAHQVFDGMPCKDIVLLPSEIPEFRSIVVKEDATRFMLGSQIDNQETEKNVGNLDLENIESRIHVSLENRNIEAYEELETSGESSEIVPSLSNEREDESAESVVLHLEEPNRETKEQSYSASFEFKGNTPFLNYELPLLEKCSWIRNYEEHFRLHFCNGRVDTSTISIFDPGIAYKTEFESRFLIQKFDGRLHNFCKSTRYSGDVYALEMQKCGYPGCVRGYRMQKCDLLSWLIEEMILPECTLKDSCYSVIFLGPDSEVLYELLCGFEDCFGSIDSFTFDPGGRIEIPLQTLVITVFDPGIVHKLDLQAVLIDGCWVLGGLIYVFDPGGEFLNFVLGSVNLCCFPFDPGGIGCP